MGRPAMTATTANILELYHKADQAALKDDSNFIDADEMFAQVMADLEKTEALHESS
jgi:hypothetical protein